MEDVSLRVEDVVAPGLPADVLDDREPPVPHCFDHPRLEPHATSEAHSSGRRAGAAGITCAGCGARPSGPGRWGGTPGTAGGGRPGRGGPCRDGRTIAGPPGPG